MISKAIKPCPNLDLEQVPKSVNSYHSMDFLNINFNKVTPQRLDILTKNYNEVCIFLLNELALPVDCVEKVTPAGYHIYHGEPDCDKQCYTAILVKEELVKFIKQIKVSPFFCKIKFCHKYFNCFFTSVYRPCDTSVKYKKCGKTRTDFFRDLKKVATDKDRFSCVIAGDFNIHFQGPKMNKSKLKALKDALPGFKNYVQKSTYRRIKKCNGKKYESCIDAVFTRGLKLDGFYHLNLKDEISTDGHLGQKGIINYDLNFAQIKNNHHTRIHASDEDITNIGTRAWKTFLEILRDKSLSRENQLKKVSCSFERLVDLAEPEVIKTRRVGFFKPVLSGKTMVWRNRMNFLRQKTVEFPENEYYKLAFYEARKIFHKLSAFDRKMYMSTTNSSIFLDKNEFFKINNKLNKSKSNLNACKIPTEDIAEGFQKLQWDNVCKIDTRDFCIDKCRPNNLANKAIFKFQPVTWSGTDKSNSLYHVLKTCKADSRGRSGLSKRFLANLPEQYREVMLELVNGSLNLGKFFNFWRNFKSN